MFSTHAAFNSCRELAYACPQGSFCVQQAICPALDLCKVIVYSTLTSAVVVAQWLIISPQEIVDDAAMQSTSDVPADQFSPPTAGDHH